MEKQTEEHTKIQEEEKEGYSGLCPNWKGKDRVSIGLVYRNIDKGGNYYMCSVCGKQVNIAKNKMEKEFIKDTIRTEHESWIDMFNEMSRVFNISKEELNKEKYKNLFKLIEKWAYEDRERRKENPEIDKFKGVLWNGEKINISDDKKS